VDPANPSLRQAVTLEFTGPGSYSINGSGSYPYTSGAPIQLNGWSVTLEGTPAAGDRFTVKDNSAGVGDNRNALAMADALAGGRLDGGRTSVADAAIRATTGLGLTTQQAQVGLEAETVMRDEAITQRQSVSGVNLDEEAANLLRYQQAYQAAAQLVRVANEMFRTLLDSTR
jgi:flagellar hook-associated protein 1 FlgK